jgi:hypothetical protein
MTEPHYITPPSKNETPRVVRLQSPNGERIVVLTIDVEPLALMLEAGWKVAAS